MAEFPPRDLSGDPTLRDGTIPDQLPPDNVATGELRHDKADDHRVNSSLLVPWSCRASFTEQVCGLAGNEHGCWRYREAEKSETKELRDFRRSTAVGPRERPPVGDDTPVAWLVFERDITQEVPPRFHRYLNAEQFAAEFLKSPRGDAGWKIHPKPNVNQAFFAFSEESLREDQPVPTPCFAAYYGCRDGFKEPVAITDWTQGSPKLFESFRGSTFLPQQIKIKDQDFNFSLADLITAYLDGACGDYRRRHRDVGVVRCKVEFALEPDALEASWVAFSYVNPRTLHLEMLSGQNLGGLKPKVLNNPVDSPDSFRPMRASEQEFNSEGSITYADTYIGAGRRQILPSEVGRSYLSFGKGEVAAYLTFWYLLRALASRREVGSEFIRNFQRWRTAYDDNNKDHTTLFVEWLATSADLVHDESCQRPEKRGRNQDASRPFVDLLETLGLVLDSRSSVPDNSGDTLYALVTFLGEQSKNTDSNSYYGFRSLPMYENLQWDPPDELVQLASDFDGLNDLDARRNAMELVLGTITNSLRRYGIPYVSNQARSILVELMRSSVIPIPHIMETRRGRLDFTHYYVIPIWEDTVRGIDRPLVFAHVFSRRLLPWERDDLVRNEGLRWQDSMIPYGSAIARNYYSVLQKSVREFETRLTLLGLISHSAGNAVAAQDWESARAFIGLVGLAARPGPLREKYQSKRSYTPEECLREAKKRFDKGREGNEERMAAVELVIMEKEMPCVEFPEKYLLSDYVITFIHEIFHNCSTHGAVKWDEDRNRKTVIVDVDLKYKWDSEKSVGILTFVILNMLTDDMGKRLTNHNGIALPRSAGEYSTHSFLSLLKGLNSHLPGVSITSEKLKMPDGFWLYSTKLELGSFNIQVTGGKMTRTVYPQIRREVVPTTGADDHS